MIFYLLKMRYKLEHLVCLCSDLWNGNQQNRLIGQEVNVTLLHHVSL